MLRRSLPAITALTLFALACSDDSTSGGSSPGGGGASGAEVPGGAGPTGGAGGGFSGCTTSEECNGGVCIAGACCAATAACGQACCGAAQVCLFEACVTPGKPCHTAADCDPGQYCETALGEDPQGGAGPGGGDVGGGSASCTAPLPIEGKCLDLPPECDQNGDPPGCVPACEYHPPVGPLNAVLKYEWGPTASAYPEHTDVWSTPTVGRVYDANCDGKVDVLDPPDIVFVSGRAINVNTGLGTCCHCTGAAVSACKSGVLRMLDGNTGAEIWSLDKPSPTSVGFSGVSTAIGDVDHDGRVDILAVTGEGYVVMVDATGTVVRTSDQPIPQAANTTFGWGGGLAVADMDHDGFPEIAYGATVFTTTNGAITLKFTGAGGIGGGTAYEALSTFVDLDGAADGNLELLAGRTAYKADGTQLWNNAAIADGFPGVGDFDLDGVPEIAHVANGNLWILDAVTGTIELGPLALPGTGFGGPPTVADFDGDGFPEVGVAKATFYSVAKPDYVNNTLTTLWSAPNHDLSSSVTGSSVFDFEGDGRAEVIYGDECFLWVYDGETGGVRFATPHSSFTATEASLVADIDGDGHSELLMVSNSADPSAAGWGCKDANGQPNTINGATWIPGPAVGESYRGIAVFGDQANSWVGTRTLWSAHTYHVSNICDDRDSACDPPNVYGDVPQFERENWMLPWLNNFRQNVQDAGIFDAPDATLSLSIPCASPLTATVSLRNQGLASLPAGVEVAVYQKAAPMDVLVGQGPSSHPLFPGQTEVFDLVLDPTATTDDTFYAVIVIDPNNPTFHQCREDNDRSADVKPACAQ